MSSALWRCVYSLLLAAGAPWIRLGLWWRGRAEPLFRHAVAERFGRYAQATEPGALWLHAVSLGETRAAAALIEALRSARPGLRLLLTHGTATGLEAGRGLLQPGDAQTWLPYDTPGAVRRFLAHWRPAAGVLMESEVWPNLLAGAAQAGVPMMLVNARRSERSQRRSRRFDALLRPAYASLVEAQAQTEGDATRLRADGVPRVAVAGNLKFDMTPDAVLLAQGAGWARLSARPLVLAVSTREGEEAALLEAWNAAAAAESGRSLPRLLIVPRHPQRFDEVAGLIQRAGHRLARRSAWLGALPDAEADAADIWLGDSVGELPAYYAAARVALLGGSFAPLGGQNLIEAAACGCPVLMGPHTDNFAEAAEQALAAGAAERMNGMDEAVVRARALAMDPEATVRMGRQALAFASAHRGAARRMAAAVLDVLDRRPAR